MSYNRVNWTANKPMNVVNLNAMDKGISDAHEALEGIEKPIDYLSSSSTAPVQSKVMYTVADNLEQGNLTNKLILNELISACCDTEVVDGGNYNLIKISEVEFLSRLQDDTEGTVSSNNKNAVTGWIPVTYGKHYALSTFHGDIGRTIEQNHFPRVQLKLNDGTVKLYSLQEYPNTNSSGTKILGVDHEDAVAMRIQFQVLDSNKTAQDISSSDLLKAYKPMLVEGNTAEEARQNAINLEYLDGDEEVPAEVEYKLKSDYTKAEKTTVDNLESRVDTLERLDTSMLYEAQKSIADDWRIPFVDVFHKLGLGSNHIIPNSYDTWGGTGNDLTQKGIMMSDGIHPSLGDGVTMMYAQAIIPQLKIVPPLYSAESEYDDWTGKNILWMGTSIPAGSDSTLGVEGIGTTYPAITANKLGATCTNIAKGSSCVRINSSSGDYNKFAYHHFIRALSRTKAEADLLQANWDSVKANITSAADTISDSDLEIMKAHSFETMLLPYLNGTKTMPDLFVIDHGHNDIRPVGIDGKQDSLVKPTIENIENGTLAKDTYMTDNNYENLKAVLNNDFSKISDVESFAASLNRNCLIGAINFIITLIYSYNPRARIVIVSDYN